jgi:hypothetical protein
MTYFCQTCGNPFKGETWRPNHFCSHKCAAIAKSNFYKASAHEFHLKTNQIQYVAGILDAEGSIWCGFQASIRLVHIKITNTHLTVLEKIKQWMKYGEIYEHAKCENHFGNKPVFEWTCQSRYASEKLLLLLLPYLRVKREKAEEAINKHVEAQPISWPYVAGFFDGEGSVSYIKSNDAYSIIITQRTSQVLTEIQVFANIGKVFKDTGTDVFRLHVVRWCEQLQFINGILPFSIVKRNELLEAQHFIQNKDWDMDRFGGHKLAHVTDNELVDLYWGKKTAIRPLAVRFGVAYNPMYQRMKKISERIGKPLRPLGTNQTFATRNKELSN